MDILELKTDADGTPVLETGTVGFNTAAQAIDKQMGRMSAYETCKGYVFVELLPGFSRSQRIADQARVMVVLSGRLRVEVDEETFQDLGPGSVARLARADGSAHKIEVIGTEPVRALVTYG